MKFNDYLTEAKIILEGGAAIKGTQPVSQVEARHIIPDIIEKISKTLNIDKKLIKNVGSAGKKPHDNDVSGDIDLAIESTPGKIELALPKLAYDEKTFRVMRGINVFSFGYKINDKIIQIDLIPVEDVSYSEWSYNAHEDDLKKDLKGSHRNEIMFAIAKFANRNVLQKDSDGNPSEVERYYYDLNKGLFSGKQTRMGRRGKVVKGWTTTEKHFLTRNPDKIAEILFGKGVTAKRISTFNGALKAFNSDKFPYPDRKKEILDQLKSGLQKKKLVIPDLT